MENIIAPLLKEVQPIGTELNSKAANDPMIQEKMKRVQISQEKLYSSRDIVHDKLQPSKENDSPYRNGDLGKEKDININGPTKNIENDEEKVFSEIQEEKQTLDELKLSLDKYLPVPQDLAKIQESSEDEKEFDKEDFVKDEGFFASLGSLPSNIQNQAYKEAIEYIRCTKYDIRELLCHLYETIELTYQSKQVPEDLHRVHKVLFELWIKWCRSKSENMDHDSQLLETLALGMSRSIALKLQSAFMDLMPKIQGLPISLQDKIQQACCDMQDLHTTFSLGNGFEDIENYILVQSQFKLTQAQACLEELLCFLEGNTPFNWVVGPLSPAKYSLQNKAGVDSAKQS